MENISAVEWLLNEMSASDWWYLPQSMKQDIIDQAKEMEKEQIIDAYDKNKMGRVNYGEQYYNETFK